MLGALSLTADVPDVDVLLAHMETLDRATFPAYQCDLLLTVWNRLSDRLSPASRHHLAALLKAEYMEAGRHYLRLADVHDSVAEAGTRVPSEWSGSALRAQAERYFATLGTSNLPGWSQEP